MTEQVILAFAFGNPHWLKSNKVIAKRAVNLARIFNADIFTQKDILIDKGVARHYCIMYAENKAIRQEDDYQEYLSTFDIIERFARCAKKEKWEKVWVVAAPQHIGRCLRDLEKTLKKENLKIEILIDSVDDYDKNTWYSEESTQWRTRSPLLWWLREIPLRIMPWRLYKKIAK